MSEFYKKEDAMDCDLSEECIQAMIKEQHNSSVQYAYKHPINNVPQKSYTTIVPPNANSNIWSISPQQQSNWNGNNNPLARSDSSAYWH